MLPVIEYDRLASDEEGYLIEDQEHDELYQEFGPPALKVYERGLELLSELDPELYGIARRKLPVLTLEESLLAASGDLFVDEPEPEIIIQVINFSTLTPDEAAIVIAHEATHIKLKHSCENWSQEERVAADVMINDGLLNKGFKLTSFPCAHGLRFIGKNCAHLSIEAIKALLPEDILDHSDPEFFIRRRKALGLPGRIK